MRILIVHNSYKEFGGEDSVVTNQIKLLTSKGNEVYSYIIDNKEIDSYRKIDKLRLLKDAYSSTKTQNEIEDIIRKFNPDIAHVHNIYPLISPVVYKVLYEKQVPIVQTLHNYRFICPNGLFFTNGKICTKCLDKNSYYQCGVNKCYHDSYVQSFWYADIISKGSKWFKYIDKFISLNQFVKEMMIKRGFDESKITIVPNFSYKMDSEDSLFFTEDDYFLYLGRLSKEKGIETLLNTIDSINGIKLYIAGDGELKEKVIDAQRKGKVKYLGFVSGVEKSALITKAKALFIPSEWHENFPMVALESMSVGTPVIASRVGGLQYLVEDGSNGYLFNPGDHNDLLEKMKYMEDKKNVSRLYRETIKIFEAKYSPEIIYKGLMDVYHSTLKEMKELD